MELSQEIIEKWVAKVQYTKPVDEDGAIIAINKIYNHSKLPPPRVAFVSSPLAAQILANIWIKNPEYIPAKYPTIKEIQAEYKRLGGKGLQSVSFAGMFGVYDYDWLASYEFRKRKDPNSTFKNEDGIKFFYEASNLEIYDMITLDRGCIVCEKPISVVKENGRLHSFDGPAIKWKDGFELFFNNGRFYPSWIFNDIKKMTRDKFLKLQNMEFRSAVNGILGEEGFAKLMGARKIDYMEHKQPSGHIDKHEHWITDDIIPDFEEKAAWVTFICSSTGTKYFVPCDPRLTLDEARRVSRPEWVPLDIPYVYHSQS